MLTYVTVRCKNCGAVVTAELTSITAGIAEVDRTEVLGFLEWSHRCNPSTRGAAELIAIEHKEDDGIPAAF